MAARNTIKSPRLSVELTQKHIDEGIARDSRHCMFAQAIKDAYPGASSVSVDLASVRFSDKEKGVRFSFMTPRVLQVCLVGFDNARKPEPFRFQLRSAQVTKMAKRRGLSQDPKAISKREQKRREQAGERLKELHRGKLVAREHGTVAERVGGRTPPQQVGSDGVPFSRRRAFGIRALEF